MIDVRHLETHADDYRRSLAQRGMQTKLVDNVLEAYAAWKSAITHLEALAEERNSKSASVPKLPLATRPTALAELKQLSEQIKSAQSVADQRKGVLDELLPKIPILCWQGVPVGKSEKDNVVRSTSGQPPVFEFTPRPYFELPLYSKWVAVDEGVKAFGSRGYYLRGPIARLQKALFDYVLGFVETSGFELFYPPLLLNPETLTGTGHLPDFEGQQYEVVVGDSQTAYLIGSSEPSLMAFYRDKTVWADDLPIRMTAWTSGLSQ